MFENLLRWVLALAFAVAAGLKLARSPEGETMFSALPPWVRVSLLTTELALAGLLVSPYLRKTTALLTTILLCGFLGALLLELSKPDPRPCGCFGMASVAASAEAARQVLWTSLVIDCFMLAAALVLLFIPRREVPAQVPSEPSSQVAETGYPGTSHNASDASDPRP